jgi:hypothetical protein
MGPAARKRQYEAHTRAVARQAAADKRAEGRRKADERRTAAKQAAERKKLQPKPARAPRKKPAPIAVNARTGQPITWRQAQTALRQAEREVQRIEAELAGAPAPKPPRARAPRAAAARPAASASARPAPKRKPARSRKPAQPPDPAVKRAGRALPRLYYAATCACQGTGRITTYKDGRVHGSAPCPTHGRPARGKKRLTAKRAQQDAGLPGLAAWLAGKRRGNLDAKQRRAVRRARNDQRHAGPTTGCPHCTGGITNRHLTDQLRDALVTKLLARDKPPGVRKAGAMARKTYPYDKCRTCGGLSVIPAAAAGDWHEQARLRKQHAPTARERPVGRPSRK